MKDFTNRSVRWIMPEFDSGKYRLVLMDDKVLVVYFGPGGKEYFELGQFVKNCSYQKDGVPEGSKGYIVEIRNPDTVDTARCEGNENPNGEYILDVVFEREGVRRRTVRQVEACPNWWEKA